MRILNFFDFYTKKLGWEIIPLLPRTKIPFMKGWNKDYDCTKVRKLLYPDCNLGLRLGKYLDVEADTPQANELLIKLTKDYPHPMWRSQKSVHHLFISVGDITRVIVNGIEFRGSLHQSMLPPSVNDEGVEYEWLVESKFPVPPLPQKLINLYKPKRTGVYVEPWCGHCGIKSRPVHKKRFQTELESFSQQGLKWLCHKCRVYFSNCFSS